MNITFEVEISEVELADGLAVRPPTLAGVFDRLAETADPDAIGSAVAARLLPADAAAVARFLREVADRIGASRP